LADSPLIDLTTLSSKAIRRLTDDELTPVLQQGFWKLYKRMITDEQLEEHLAAVRKGHWAPGLPAHTNGNNADNLF
jgi:DNA-binding transcriptional ArsR family regulator